MGLFLCCRAVSKHACAARRGDRPLVFRRPSNRSAVPRPAPMSVSPLLPMCSPRAQMALLEAYTPRSRALYSPRTHGEQLACTGTQLNDALSTAAEIAEALVRLSERAERQRSVFVDTAREACAQSACPICMETISEPLECSNHHKFCGSCLRRYRESCSKFLCPLCRVAISPAILSRKPVG